MLRLSHLRTFLLAPVAAALTLPLVPFAVATTMAAVVCLALRALYIYAELTGSLLKQLILRPDPPVALALAEYSLKSSQNQQHQHHHQQRQQQRPPLLSFSSSGSVTPRRPATPYASYGAPPPPSVGSAGSGSGGSAGGNGGGGGGGAHSRGHGSSHSMYLLGSAGASSSLDRDYEGVGGWRDIGDDDPSDDDAQWTGLNRRLELPASFHASVGVGGFGGAGSGGGGGIGGGGRPGHRRSLTGGSIKSSFDRGLSALSLRSNGGGGANSAVSGGSIGGDGGTSIGRRPSRADSAASTGAGATGTAGMRSGTVSPDEGLTMKTRSMVDIGMNVGRARSSRERRKSVSSTSNSSGNSHRTMTATTGGGWMAP